MNNPLIQNTLSIISRTTKKSMVWQIFGVILVVTNFLTLSLFHWDWTLDDSYISFRFADNLSDGNGIRWNSTDESPLEGFTSFLWVISLALLNFLGLETLDAAKCLGIFSSLFTMGILFWQGNPKDSPLVSFFAIIAISTHPYIFVHAIAGMETSFYMLFVTTQATLSIIANRNYKLEYLYLGSITVTFMVRPESLVFSGALFMGYLVVNRDRWMNICLHALIATVIPSVTYWTAKSLYFGHIVPTPFMFKQGTDLTTWWTSNGLSYVLQFVSRSIMGGIALIVTMWALKIKIRPIYLAVLIAVLIQLIYFTTVRPTVGIADRFLLPFLPAFLLVVCEYIRLIINRQPQYVSNFSNYKTTIGKWVHVSILILVLIWSVDTGHRYEQIVGLENYFSNRVINPAIANSINNLDDNPQNVVLATGEAGALPYITGYRHIDFYGLASEKIAYSGWNSNVIYEANPDIIITHSIKFSAIDGKYIPDQGEIQEYVAPYMHLNSIPPYEIGTGLTSYLLMLDKRFEEYHLVRDINNPESDKQFYIFARRDSKYFESIIQKTKAIDLESEIQKYRRKHSVNGFAQYLNFW